MLPAQRLSQRAALRSWLAGLRPQRRQFSDDNGKPDRRNSRERGTRESIRSRGQARPGQSKDGQHTAAEPEKPSLVEQLFPEEYKRYDGEQQASREVPRLPVQPVPTLRPLRQRAGTESDGPVKSWRARQAELDREAAGPGTSVLVLRNASPNLTEEDFRRLIPQGRHLEGWTLEQGNFIKVIAGRDLTNLAHENDYYLLFSSPLDAFTFQGHVQRIHHIAVHHTPTSSISDIPPPPGYKVDGLDAEAAMAAYTLVPHSQKLELRQLRPPLTPVMQSIVQHHGYPSIVNREQKMPFEVRLTMEGPQLHASAVRHVLMESGKARGLSWSGGDNMNLQVTRWKPRNMPSPLSRSGDSWGRVNREERLRDEDGVRESEEAKKSETEDDELKRRTPPEVYIVGFHTQNAATSFVSHWNRRPLEAPGGDMRDVLEGDIPPVANVELLW